MVIAYVKAALLAIVEGATEFLPVSSTGHLIIVDAFIRLTEDQAFNDSFMVIIQLPAILAVVAYFWADLWPFSRTGGDRRALLSLWMKILLAVIPALVLGALFDDFLEAHLFAPVPVAVALIVGGVVLILLERAGREVVYEKTGDLPFRTVLLIGLIQCLAMIPGTSRSAASIIGGMALGASRRAAAEFSFFLAIPTMFAATGYKMLKQGFAFTGEQWALLGVGSIVSFAVAYAVIAAFMGFIRKRSFEVFGYYRIALGGFVLIAAWLGWIGD
jgi:undecaprenyl-diphosphatase